MARQKKYSRQKLLALFNRYEQECKNRKRLVSDFDHKSGTRVESEIPAPIPCTLIGFLVYIGLSRRSWYEVYKPQYPETCQSILDRCELSNLESFLQGNSPPQLAPLILANYGYKKPKEDLQETASAEGEGTGEADTVIIKGSEGYEE